MALTVGDRDVRPLTADDVFRMVEVGILGEDDPVELLSGVLTEVSPKSPEHGLVIARIVRWLVLADAEHRHEVLIEHPLLVPDRTSLPEPDIAVVERDATTSEHPRTALLVVEVAVSSRRTDVEVKAPLYAAAGVPEYWVVDVRDRAVYVFSSPDVGAYGRRVALRAPDVARPGGIGAEPLELAGLFAGL